MRLGLSDSSRVMVLELGCDILKAFLTIFAIALGALLSPGSAYSDTTSSALPALCLGYDPEDNSWGARGIPAPSSVKSDCPRGQAYFGTAVNIGRIQSGDEVSTLGFCCPLPAGSLTEEHSYSAESCPEGSVATGARHGPVKSGSRKAPTYLLRCTKIATDRFVLGPRRGGARVVVAKEYFRDVFRQLFPAIAGDYTARLSWGSIPMSIRYGLGRMSLVSWVPEFCVGQPPGSVLVGKSGKECKDGSYRELRAKVVDGSGANVALEERECLAIDNLFSAKARCLREHPRPLER